MTGDDARISTPRAILFLVVLNLAAHFIPFERASLSPDDYYSLLKAGDLKSGSVLAMMAVYPERPISSAIVMLRSKLFADQVRVPLALLFVLSSAVLLCVHATFQILLHDQRESLLASVVFCLLPNKLESYHASVNIFMNFAVVCYLLCLILFLRAVHRDSLAIACGSALAYTIGLFSYEVGFFAPVVLLVWCLMYRRQGLKYVGILVVPALSYSIYRVMLLRATYEATHHTGFQLRPARDLFHHYAGAYLARSVLYGGYEFFSIETPWLMLVVLADSMLLFGILRFRPREFRPTDPRLLVLAVAMFACFLLPLFLQERGGIAGRHLMLPSLGVVLMLLPLLRRASMGHPGWWTAAVGAGLLVSQGNAWTHVVSCRINAALYDSMRGMKGCLRAAEDVLVDVRSFRDAIPSGGIRFEHDFLNFYYGAQTFEDWSLRSMVRLASGQNDKRVHIVVEGPIREGGMLSFVEAQGTGTGSRSLTRTPIVLEAAKAVTIDFESVYGDGFRNGTPRRPRAPSCEGS